MGKQLRTLSPDASKEILDELSKPAADTPQRRKAFKEVKELEKRLKEQGFTFGNPARKRGK